MSLVLARIDCRLIHGQVVETWIPHVNANLLIVANDDLYANPVLRSVMELAVPSGNPRADSAASTRRSRRSRRRTAPGTGRCCWYRTRPTP